jgi:uncharacterized iron-regulated membrane protein
MRRGQSVICIVRLDIPTSRGQETAVIKPLLLKLHRWTSLVFALPMFAIIATGLILSVEPMVQFDGIKPGSVDAAQVVDLIKRHDPDGTARGLFINSAAQRLTLQGANMPEIDLVTGEAATTRSVLADVFLWARRSHERLLGLPWLVSASTIAMIAVMCLGIGMGLPRLRNSLAGWHKGAAWFTLPLILLSPLTGLCMTFDLTFQGDARPPGGGRPLALPEAVRVIAQSHDLAQVISIGSRGGRTMVRLFEGGELRAYAVNADGMTALPRNWPRLIHEGNWAAVVASPLNLIVAVVLLGLLSTGLVLWGRRQLRRQGRGRNDSGARAVLKSAA